MKLKKNKKNIYIFSHLKNVLELGLSELGKHAAGSDGQSTIGPLFWF